jgi:LPS export ABC transporter protein LptC
MRIDRKASRYIAFGVVGAVILLAILLGSSKNKQSSLPSIELLKNADGTFDASVVFGEFRKSEVKDGKKQWEVYAKVGRYRPKDGKAELENPIVWLYREDDVIELTAQKGLVTLEGTGLKNVETTGNVVIVSKNRQTTVKSEKMFYDQTTEQITAPGLVNIESPRIITSGFNLKGNTRLSRFTLEDQVQTTIQPQENKKP